MKNQYCVPRIPNQYCVPRIPNSPEFPPEFPPPNSPRIPLPESPFGKTGPFGGTTRLRIGWDEQITFDGDKRCPK